ncbi:Hypothetical predicted protein [Marmota monax]|uniref:PAR14-like first RRM domain-containing protein n=1 Tax=Marmota monax TaxID=9995 RepID=A0A5E4B119_MARMO|nr:hypothetical protein GHT09_003766 [Marmota monax]VTJ63374.1 Hypothetical predicted protein [Marmota monax]
MAALLPALVEGSWGPNPPKNLSAKLQMYFQSRERSGCGEFEVHQEPGSPPRFLGGALGTAGDPAAWSHAKRFSVRGPDSAGLRLHIPRSGVQNYHFS